MTNYDKLVKALRFETDYVSVEKTMSDAADAIEELQQIADHHEQTAKDYWKEACEYKAQLPKRGEWIHNVAVQGTTAGGVTFYHGYTCSVCGALMGRKGDAYCYKCGAKMEVQE